MKGDKTLATFLKACPRLAELSASLALRLHCRDGVLWAEDVQLTFEYRNVKGKQVRLATIEQKCELALEILGWVQSARSAWGSLLQRARHIISRFDRECVKPFNVQRMHWTVVRDNSLDSVSVFGGGPFANRGFEVVLTLIGEPALMASGQSLREATDKLLASAEVKYKHQRKSQRPTRPFNSDDELARLKKLMGVKGSEVAQAVE